jgi:hypothetical protein
MSIDVPTRVVDGARAGGRARLNLVDIEHAIKYLAH